jgi:hypothetical protein
VLYFSICKLRNITNLHNAHVYIRSKSLKKQRFIKTDIVVLQDHYTLNVKDHKYTITIVWQVFVLNNNKTCIYLLLFEVVVYVTEHWRRLFKSLYLINLFVECCFNGNQQLQFIMIYGWLTRWQVILIHLNYHPLKHLQLHTFIHHVYDSTSCTITLSHTLNYTRSFTMISILHWKLSSPTHTHTL